jgi:acyl carrier protein
MNIITNTGARHDAGPTPDHTHTERILVEIWSEVLKLDRVDLHHDFLDLGGHSLSATLCINRIKDALAIELPMDMFLVAPAHIAGIAAEIDSLRRASLEPVHPFAIS